MSTLTITIGGTVLNLQYDPDLMHLKTLPSVYRPFVQTYDSVPPSVDINIVMRPGPGPDTKRLEQIFDSGHALRIYKGSGYIISNTIPGDEQPEWLAEISPDLKHADIYCGDRMIDQHDSTKTTVNPLQYPLDQILMMFILAKRQGLLLHSAGISSIDKGIVFPGSSGAGKSTLMKQFSRDSTLRILSDDRVLLRKIDNTQTVWGTPWPGEGGWAANIGVPLTAICFIKQGSENQITPLNSQAAAAALLPVASIPWYDKALMSDCLSICEALVKETACFILECTPDGDAVQTIDSLFSGKRRAAEP